MDAVRLRLPAVAVWAAFAFFGSMANVARAQVTDDDWLLPRGGIFAPLVADPLEPRFAGGLISTNLFSPSQPHLERDAAAFEDGYRLDSDLQGVAMLGGTVPVLRLRHGAGAAVLVGLQAGVFARFRMQPPHFDNISADWLAAIPIEAGRGRVSGRFRLLHRSSHLGDNLMEATGAERISFSHEGADLVVAYRTGRRSRVYGGGTYLFRATSEGNGAMQTLARSDRFALQAGAEALWRPWSDTRIAILAAGDWQAAERTGWRSARSLVSGLAFEGAGRTLQLRLTYFTGPSPVHQFFLTSESFWGIELHAEI